MKRGDVVEMDWPYTDRTDSKIRPALVVQADYLDVITDDRILVRIGSKAYGITGTEVPIDPAQEALSGLKKKCFVACSDILTFDQSLIMRKIGVLSDATMKIVDECLQAALQLP
jgi:mRNA-degrading endonuclease toxin of MazEF toxin-antitoxin module